MFIPHQKQKTPEELQQERIAKEAKQWKEDFDKMTPEERAKFWTEHDRDTSSDKE